MLSEKFKAENSFRKPAVYKIKVQGELRESWSERLGGLQINVERSPGKEPLSTLIGQISDQSALSGVLNTLYELHLTIIIYKHIER
jgi:hypothetical protein